MDIHLKEKMSENMEIVIPKISREKIDLFESYYDEISRWKMKMNLTSLHGWELVRKLFIESLLFSKLFNPISKICILDIGTGAGFPGLPLKIVFNDIKLHLIEKDRKKISFLENLTARLKLNDITLHKTRIEEFISNIDYPDHFNLILSRAISLPESVISKFCSLLKDDGLYIRKQCSEPGDKLKFKTIKLDNPWNKNDPYFYEAIGVDELK